MCCDSWIRPQKGKKKSKFLQLLVESASQSPGAARGRSTVKAMTANLTPRRTWSHFQDCTVRIRRGVTKKSPPQKEKKRTSNPGKKEGKKLTVTRGDSINMSVPTIECSSIEIEPNPSDLAAPLSLRINFSSDGEIQQGSWVVRVRSSCSFASRPNQTRSRVLCSTWST